MEFDYKRQKLIVSFEGTNVTQRQCAVVEDSKGGRAVYCACVSVVNVGDWGM